MICLLTCILLILVYETEQRGPPGIATAPSDPPVTPAPIRRQPSVVQTTWAPQIDQTNTWQQSQQQQPQQSNWGQDNQPATDEAWNPEWSNRGPPPPEWRDRGPPPPDFDDWHHHRPPWRRGPWWRRPPPPWGPPPPGPPPPGPPPFGWRGL